MVVDICRRRLLIRDMGLPFPTWVQKDSHSRQQCMYNGWVSDGQGLIEDCMYEDLTMVGEEVYQLHEW